MGRVIWAAGGLFVFLQAVFYLATLVWPAEADFPALLIRLSLWDAAHGLFAQLFVGMPVLLLLTLRARGMLERGAIAFALVATGAIVLIAALEVEALARFANDTTSPKSALRWLGLARWADAGLALAALVALRLAWRAERTRAEPSSSDTTPARDTP